MRMGDAKAHPYIYPAEDGTYHFAHQVKLPAGSPLGDWEFLIDAHTGEILGQSNLLMHVNGTGTVYEENPITTRSSVSRGLPHLDGSGFLKGDFVNVLIYNGSTGVRTNSRDFNRSLVNNARAIAS